MPGVPGKRAQWIGMVLAVAACLGIALVLIPAPATPRAGGASAHGMATTSVSRTTLLDTRRETGTLGYGDPVGVPFISRARTGIVTWMAPEGAIVSRGEPLFAIDGQPVILLYGKLPFFRTLRFEGEGFDEFEWFELINAQDDERKAELNMALQRARLAEAELRLKEARVHVTDSERAEPVTPQFIRLNEAIVAAGDRLRRIERLAEAEFASAAEIQQAHYELSVAQADLDAAIRDRTQQLAAAETAAAEARVAVLEAERALRDARDALGALLTIANENADIELLRENLAVLGFEGPAAETIRRWQSSVGRSATGLIEPGQIVVSDGPVRVAEHMVDVGDIVFGGLDGQSGFAPDNNSSDLVMRYTGTDRLVTVPMEIADHAYARAGDEVVVTLPTDAEIPGVIGEVSSVFNEQGLADAVIEIPDQARLGTLEAASVDVEFVIGRREDVLAVPIAALLALPEGGFGVEIVERNASRIVPVDTGLFARGSVEISGADIAEGVTVGIPR